MTPAGRGKGSRVSAAAGDDGAPTVAGNESEQVATPAQRMTWAQQLRRVFRNDVETCPKCGRSVKIIANIEDEEVIEKILAHINEVV